MILTKLVNIYKKICEKEMKRSFRDCGDNVRVRYPFFITNPDLIQIGKNTEIMSDCRMQVYNSLTKLDSKITIGENNFFGNRLCILAGGNITIGSSVTFASNVCILSENHGINPECILNYGDQPLICADVSVGNGCWIGQNVTILPGVTIGEKSVIGAGSVVTRDIPAYCIAVGNPARVIKKYNFSKHEWEKYEGE